MYKESIFHGRFSGSVRKDVLEFLKSKGLDSITYYNQLDANIVQMLLTRFDKRSIEENGFVYLSHLDN